MSTITAEDGKARFVAGRLTYPTPPELGTIVGPNSVGEYLVVIGHDGPVTLLGYATTDEIRTASDGLLAGVAPRSVTEARRGMP